MARRNTTITLYSTGRVDPTYKNIIGFNSIAERDAWLARKPSLTVSRCKYWRVGDPLRMPLTYDKAFVYDYAKIVNHVGEASQEVYFAFIAGRSYVNDGLTLMAVDVDWVQTYYFTKGADGSGLPFYMLTGGFLNMSTQAGNPPRGTPAEYNVPESVANAFIYNTEGYSLIVYSTVDLRQYVGSVPSEPQYIPGYCDGGILTAFPYLIYGAGNVSVMASLMTNIFRNLNTGGVVDAVQGAYMIPNIVLADTLSPGAVVVWSDNYGTERTITLTKPTACDGYTPTNKQLLGYDYTYITINNGQGETAKYNFEDFSGNPTFVCSLSVASGSPVIMIRPGNNYLYGNLNEYRQRMMKITQAPAVSWLNDSYAIWLAQTQNSRAAAIEGANLAISQAKEARSNSWAYKFGGTVKGLQQGLRDPVINMGNNILNKFSMLGDIASGAANVASNVVAVASGEKTVSDAVIDSAPQSAHQKEYTLREYLDASKALRAQGITNPQDYQIVNWLNDRDGGTRTTSQYYTGSDQALAADVTKAGGFVGAGAAEAAAQAKQTAAIAERQSKDYSNILGGMYDMGMAYLNHELGIETTYTYDHAVANAQHSLDALLAGYADKAKIPATAVGSNAYGDTLKYQQYGFMLTVWTPTAEYARIIDNLLSSSGHTINAPVSALTKTHRYFDYWKFSAARISPDPQSRPEFVRRLMLSLFDNGVYVWYIYNNDVSDYWGSPYGLNNP